MRQSAFANYDNRTTHERWCDAMVKKTNNQRAKIGTMRAKPAVKEPTYTNYELKKLLLGLTF